jgi:exosome complex RNA-binding protein Rrp42 (RNase PH superfamily)
LRRRLYPFTFVIAGQWVTVHWRGLTCSYRSGSGVLFFLFLSPRRRDYLVDPTAAEEEVAQAIVSVCLDDDGNLCSFESIGELTTTNRF